MRPQIKRYGMQRLIRNRGWARAWALVNLVNTSGSGVKIPNWLPQDRKVKKVKEILKATAIAEIKKEK